MMRGQGLDGMIDGWGKAVYSDIEPTRRIAYRTTSRTPMATSFRGCPR